MATKTPREPAVKPVSVQLSPPAYRIRQQAGLGLPSGRQLSEALFGVIAGAALSAVFITALNSKGQSWVGALLTGTLGGVLASTSPIGTFAQEIGMGALATSAGWAYFDVTGQFVPPVQASQQASVAAAPMVLPRIRRVA